MNPSRKPGTLVDTSRSDGRQGIGRLDSLLAIDPLLSIEDLSTLLKCSRRLVERLRSAGKIPPPDLHVGRMPRWRRETVKNWLDGAS